MEPELKLKTLEIPKKGEPDLEEYHEEEENQKMDQEKKFKKELTNFLKEKKIGNG